MRGDRLSLEGKAYTLTYFSVNYYKAKNALPRK
jgi:hypothetical protein